MRLRKLELAVIGLTLAFVCFLGGYFTGARTAVNVVSVATNDGLAGQTSAKDELITGSDVSDTGSTQTFYRYTGKNGATHTGDTAQGVEPSPSYRDSMGRININLASRNELMDLPGIGSVLAERIIEYRNQNGPFAQIEDLRNVSGIGERRFDTIKDKVTV